MNSTDYENTLIEIAEDCKAKAGEMPPYRREKKTAANQEYEIIYNKKEPVFREALAARGIQDFFSSIGNIGNFEIHRLNSSSNSRF